MTEYAWRFWGLLATGWAMCAGVQLLVGVTSGQVWWTSMALMPAALGSVWAIGATIGAIGGRRSAPPKKPVRRDAGRKHGFMRGVPSPLGDGGWHAVDLGGGDVLTADPPCTCGNPGRHCTCGSGYGGGA